MNNPLVSIGLPTYNNSETIIICLKSIFAQTYANWELIIVNDGSTDDTYELIKDICDPRVKIINDGFNKGLIYRLNQIIDLSNGEYIARMDGDDIMHPFRIEEQVNYLKNNSDVDIADTGVVSMSQDGIPEGMRRMENISNSYVDTLHSCPLTHPAVMGKRTWFMENRYDNKYLRAEDFELWCRTFQKSKFGRVIKPLHFFREGNISINNYLKSSAMARLIFKEYAPPVIGNLKTHFFSFKNVAKSLIYAVFGSANMQYYLTRKRNAKLTKIEKDQFEDIISGIEKIIIPKKNAKGASSTVLS